ncbi:DUF6069 family protein [Promicromonospora thailandica]|uniref:Uncharacterized protein n=1 Tax=Promicromonospora thailandica TaxID=765201 RepID=A0A9X2G612_9MICO|nr:DUF6069 family protein [Promicromonospora thailandica]MCP2266285.1 hypothetical protein [Promicromonospora thailandica]BFF19951.1 hypothetical protein GCM10025730_34720 [Promicromonospora thailandica]
MAENAAVRSPWPAWTVPLAAAVAALAVWLIGVALGVEPEARAGGSIQAVTVPAVLATALAAGFAGWGARALVARFVKGGGETVWFVLCAVVFLGSLVGAAGGTTPGAVALLVVLHLTVAVVVAVGLRRAVPAAVRARGANA